MNAVDVIIRKRDGFELTRDEIDFFVAGLTNGTIPDYQVAAWAMAIFFRGMTDAETTALTLAMAASGDQLDLHDAVPPGVMIVDKHSSGGVGDKTTLAVAPIVAACGLPVGKMSGRGLSFSGGTIDKLESIAGWRSELSDQQFRRQLATVGLVIAGQTAELAPADKVLYALRDVTGTVPSLPLIAASIMSKKLAAGADAIVLDVKCGQGAFMQTLADAQALARLMVEIGTRAGRRMVALITQMDQPLGNAVGNALEVDEAIATLRNAGPPDLRRLVEHLAAEMLQLGASSSPAAASAQIQAVLASGAALAKFREFVAAQGGDVRMIDQPDRLSQARLPQAKVQLPIVSERSGWVRRIDARQIGLAVVDLGGGRRRKGDVIDPAVGVVLQAKVGQRVEQGEPFCVVHAADQASARRAQAEVASAFTLQDDPVAELPILLDRIASA